MIMQIIRRKKLNIWESIIILLNKPKIVNLWLKIIKIIYPPILEYPTWILIIPHKYYGERGRSLFFVSVWKFLKKIRITQIKQIWTVQTIPQLKWNYCSFLRVNYGLKDCILFFFYVLGESTVLKDVHVTSFTFSYFVYKIIDKTCLEIISV